MPTHKENLEHIVKLPKYEPHAHFNGSVSRDWLKKVAKKPSELLAFANFEAAQAKLNSRVTYAESFECFKNVYELVNTYDRVREGVIELCNDWHKDGVVYAELRSGLRDFGKGYEPYLQAMLDGIMQAPAGLKVNILLSLRRDSSPKMVGATINLAIRYRQFGVVGIDISGESTLPWGSHIIPALKYAKYVHKLKIALHIGESPEEIQTEQQRIAQRKILEDLMPDRIGHGVYLAPQALSFVLRERIPVEVCLQSSVYTAMVEDQLQHPGLSFYLDHDHPILLGTDDKLLFDKSLSEEYCILLEHEKIKLPRIYELVGQSFRYAFLPEAEKEKYIAQVQAAIAGSERSKLSCKL